MASNWRHQAAGLPDTTEIKGVAVTTKLDQARNVLARANRIIANEGVLDAFGHVSMRHPTDPGRYLLARSRAPELVQPDDILEFTLDSQRLGQPMSGYMANASYTAASIKHGPT